MALLRILLLAVAVVGCSSSADSATPVEKVIKLLEDLKTEVEGEGQAEATTYDTFACFCKDSTSTKSGSITTGQDNIDSLSATIQEDTASQATKTTEVDERNVKMTELGSDLKSTKERCQKEDAEFEANIADLTKAVSSLDGAIKALGASKPAASLLAIGQTVEDSLALAEAMSLVEAPKLKAVHSFLQQGADPIDPEYKYHSQSIIDTLNELLTEFTDSKTETETEWKKAKDACAATKKSISDDMASNDAAIKLLEGEINGLKTSIAENRESLVSAEALLKDDQTYLKDVTMRCESRAKEWDQRSQLRAGELKALAQALSILTDRVLAVEGTRALVQQRKQAVPPAPISALAPRRSSGPAAAGVVAASRAPQAAAALLPAAAPAQIARRLSFLQQGSRLRAGARAHKEDLARGVLQREGDRLQSPRLSAIAERVAADPFAKVKTLIQGLIERLLNEATQEATKKGYCDTELGKATKDRDFRWMDVEKLSAELSSLQAKKDQLTQEIADAADSANATSMELTEASTERSDSKAVNLNTIKEAKEGLAAVTEAISILKAFYKQAAKAKTLLQESPVEQDDPGAGFDGVYTGKQDSSTGILGLLEVIRADFERTVSTTAASEKKAAEDYVDFDRMSKSSIAEQLKGKELNEQDLESTKNAITQMMTDIGSSSNLLDSALKTIEDLKPMCIDNVMTFAERTQKREEEIAALKQALCYLDPNQVEEECQTR